MKNRYNALRSSNETFRRLSYAQAGLTPEGERPDYGVHIEQDDYQGKIDAEKRARKNMTPGSLEYRESEAREQYYRNRLMEQPGYRELVSGAYGLPMQAEVAENNLPEMEF